MAIGRTNSGTGGGTGKSEIIVTGPDGFSCYLLSPDGKQKTTTPKDGVYTFRNCGVGAWPVKATSSDGKITDSIVNIEAEGQLMRYYVKINFRLTPLSFDLDSYGTLGTDYEVVYDDDTAIPKELWGSVENWKIRLLDGGSITVDTDDYIDVFMVGGASACEASSTQRYWGVGGEVKTRLFQQIKEGQSYSVVIGPGGAKNTKENGGDTTAFGFTASGGIYEYHAPQKERTYEWNGTSGKLYGGNYDVPGDAPPNTGSGAMSVLNRVDWYPAGGSGIVIIRNARAKPSNKVYGITIDTNQQSPAWTRTDDAVGLTATASVGTVAGHSDFDRCYPWGVMQRIGMPTGDIVTKIHKFWFRRFRDVNGIEHIKIGDSFFQGSKVHPMFTHGGVEKDYHCVASFETSSNNMSVSGASPTVSQTRATFRTNAKNKGAGWYQWDIATLSGIQLLYLVEFANNNSQTMIGRGICDTSSKINTGSCDSVPNLTGRPAGTDGQTGVVYRGIENLWGNIWKWVDGVNWNSGTYYVCNNPSKYEDNTDTGYTKLTFNGATNWSRDYITSEGIDQEENTHVILPTIAGTGSETTYACDVVWSSTGWLIFANGGSYGYDNRVGIFASSLDSASSRTQDYIGSRLMYIPQEGDIL